MRRRHRHGVDEAEIDMTPMLDVTFIMLIFFIVTTSFVKEYSVDVNRPSGQPSATQQKQEVVVVQIDRAGTIRLNDRVIDAAAVQANVQSELASKTDATVLVVTNKAANTGVMVKVLDGARAAGAKKISVATSS